MEALIYLIIFGGLLVLGFVIGRRTETKHYASIREREEKYRNIMIVQSKIPPDVGPCDTVFVSGAVVIGQDYFKAQFARIKKIFGGRITPYESLLERARREAVLRLKEEAARQNAQYVCNLKFGTSDIMSFQKQQATDGVEVIVTGTAIRVNG